MISSDDKRLIAALEASLNVSHETSRKPISKRELNKAVDIVLRRWGFTHRRTNGREAERDTGNYGSPGKREGIDAVYDMVDAQFDHVQYVISQLPEYARCFIFLHYLKRPRIIDELQMSNQMQPKESVSEYKKRLEAIYYEKIDYAKSTYGRHLSEAKYDFMAYGGLL